MQFAKQKSQAPKLDLGPMIDCTFLLLIYFIVSLQMEPSLDNIIKLPPVLRADKQEETMLQIYILPAKLRDDGSVVADSTGLIAFSDKAKMPDSCPTCQVGLKGANGAYIPGALFDHNGEAIADIRAQMAIILKDNNAPPPVFHCASCKGEVGPYVKLSEIPIVLREKKKEVLELMVRNRNAKRANFVPQQAALDSLEIEALKDSIPLMIKADEQTFYGRILQVVNMAKDTAAGIKNFAFVTLSESSADAKETLEKSKQKRKPR